MNFLNPLSFRRVEIPMEIDTDAIEISYGIIEPSISTGEKIYWGSGQGFSSGDYRIKYVGGALRYSFSEGSAYYLNLNEHGFYFLANNEAELQFPATEKSEGFVSQAAAEAFYVSASVSFTHAGGRIGMYLKDSPYTDNVSDKFSPRFELVKIESRSVVIEAEYISPMFGDLFSADDGYSSSEGGVSEL